MLSLTPQEVACLALGYTSKQAARIPYPPPHNRYKMLCVNEPLVDKLDTFFWDQGCNLWINTKSGRAAVGNYSVDPRSHVTIRRLDWWELPPCTAFEAGFTDEKAKRRDRIAVNKLLTLPPGYRFVSPGEMKLGGDECFQIEANWSDDNNYVPHWRAVNYFGIVDCDLYPVRRQL